MTIDKVAQSTLAVGRQFFSWWTDELFGCLPRSLDLRRRWTRGDWVLLVTTQELLMGRDRGPDGIETLERFAIKDGTIAPSSAQRALLAEFDPQASFTLRLPSELALRRTIRMPIAALENLREAVAFQLDRYTPFSHDQAYFDYVVVQRDDGVGQLMIEATVIARAIVSSACAMVDRLGLHVAAVEVAREDAVGTKPATRLSVPALRRQPRVQSAVNLGVAIVLFALCATAIALPLVRMQHQARILAGQLDDVRRQSAAATHLSAENETLRREANFLANRAARPSALDILLELTKLTPGDSWLESLQYVGNRVDFSGLSSSASTLIERLAHSNLFHNMQFRSPVTPDSRFGRERFQISGEITGAAAKPASAPTPIPEPQL